MAKDAKVYHTQFAAPLPGEADYQDFHPGVNIIDGVPCMIEPKWIDILLDMEHESHLTDRYYTENVDLSVEMSSLADDRHNPEIVLFCQTQDDNKIEAVRDSIFTMSEAQIDLCYDRYGSLEKQVDIADKLGLTEGAIRKRLRKIQQHVENDVKDII